MSVTKVYGEDAAGVTRVLKIDSGGAMQSVSAQDFSPHCNALLMAADTERTFVVPDGMHYVSFFSTTINVYVRKNATVTIPVADITDGTAGEPNPVLLRVEPGDTLHIRSATAGIVSVIFYA